MESLGQRIATALERAQKTQKDLAVACGVCPPAVSQWIGGHTVPTVENLRRVAAALGVSVGSLVDGTASVASEESGAA